MFEIRATAYHHPEPGDVADAGKGVHARPEHHQ